MVVPAVHRIPPFTAVQNPVPCRWVSNQHLTGTVYGFPVTVPAPSPYGRMPYTVRRTALLREGPTRPSRPRLRNENPPPPIEKHFALQPVSTNTVPVGLCKALANGNGSSNGHSSNASTPEGEEQRTRRAVRSYLSSREIFEPVRPRHFSQGITWSRFRQPPAGHLTRARAAARSSSRPSFSHYFKTSFPVSWVSPTAWPRPSRPRNSLTPSRKQTLRSIMATNSDPLAQLSKARAQYGVVRAEKDVMLERISSAEAERLAVRQGRRDPGARVAAPGERLHFAGAHCGAGRGAIALAQLKMSDVTIESRQERLLELEKPN
ncbi:hypothetical protein EDB85DRAFT_244904 [Lactarius pseudohatsudake]|nr:hypothetical protein EDB85DRAFT_244904 [Lactarius pseudohatsudake]